MKTIFLLTFFMLTCIFSVLGQQTWQQLDSLGKVAMNRKAYTEADSLYQLAINQIVHKHGQNDTLKVDVLFNRFYNYYYMNQTEKAMQCLLEGKSILELKKLTKTKKYSIILHNIATMYRTTRKFDQAEKAYFETLEVRKSIFGEKSLDYCLSKMGLAFLYRDFSMYKQAAEHLEEVIVLFDTFIDKQSVDYISAKGNLASIYIELGKYNEAENMFKETTEITIEKYGKKSENYVSILNNFSGFYRTTGNLKMSEKMYLEVKALKEDLWGKNNVSYAGTCFNLAVLYSEMELFDKSEALFLETQKIWLTQLGTKHPNYALVCSDLGLLYNKMGLYEKAEEQLLIAKEIRKNHFGEKHREYAKTCSNLANIYFMLGLHERANKLYTEAAQIIKENDATESLQYAYILNNIGTIHMERKDYDAAENLYLQSMQIKEKIQGKLHNEYVVSLQNLGLLYSRMGKYDLALLNLHKSKKNCEDNHGGNNTLLGNIFQNIGDTFVSMNNIDSAEYYYLKTYHLRSKNNNTSHQYYSMITYRLSLLYYKSNRVDLAKEYFNKTYTSDYQKIKSFFPFLSFADKQNYFNTLSNNFNLYYNFVAEEYPNNTQLLAELFDQILFTKGCILYSLNKIKQTVLDSKDSVLMEQFESWRKAKELYNKKIETQSIDTDSILNEIELLEKAISKKSHKFAKEYQLSAPSWKQVQAQLKEREIAIEIINVTKFKDINNHDLGKQMYIALFITKKTTNNPEIIIIENANELENKFLNYYKNSIDFKKEDKLSYTNFFAPIEQKLKEINPKGFSKIYFSPDGVYHQINLNTLYDTERKQFVTDLYNIQLVGSTRDLIEYGTEQNKLSQLFKEKESYFFGYPIYDLENKNNAIENKDQDRSLRYSNVQDAIGKNIIWPLLEGTKSEVENISASFQKNKFKHVIFLAEEATEAELKKTINPVILHIATHGFFVQSYKEKIETLQDAQRKQFLENPFMRSGLVFAGCQNPKDDQEDGILTAEEAINLTLDNTELVVLSACETGLGDIQNGEGVFGLQRAFQQAGAKSVIMSLWKVSDEATQILMTEFYNALLKGKTKREAFLIAQNKLRKQFPHPYYWGAFVMVGR